MRRTACLLLLLVACRKEEPPPTPAPVMRVERASVAVASIRYVASGPRFSGTLQPQQSASILAETAGTVVGVSAAEGQAVTRGTLLARIVDEAAAETLRSAQVALQSARTALAVAQRDYERASRLAAAGALPARDAEVARSQVASAQGQVGLARAQLSTARDRVGNQTVVSPVSGIISVKSVSTGDVVAPGTALFTIVDLGTLQLEATVPADALAGLEAGVPVDVEVRGYPGERFPGTVTRIAPTVDPGTGQVRIYISIANQGKRLVGGLFAEGVVRSVSRQALVVPIEALDENGASSTVVRVRNGATERVPVRTGLRNEAEGYVEILSGLSPGDMVLVGPARTMTPGTKVKVG